MQIVDLEVVEQIDTTVILRGEYLWKIHHGCLPRMGEYREIDLFCCRKYLK